MFCLVRELPEQKGLDRIRASLVQYGILPSHREKPTEEQHILEEKLERRITPIKGLFDVGNLFLLYVRVSSTCLFFYFQLL